MFTETIDNAAMRVTRDGVEYAAAYDTYATNPLDRYEVGGIAVIRDYRNSCAYDPDGVMEAYIDAQDALECSVNTLECGVDFVRETHGKEWWNSIDEGTADYLTGLFEDAIACEEALNSYEVFEYKETGLYGWPKFTVVVDTEMFKKTWGDTREDWQGIYKALAKDYAYWAEGEVMVVGYEGPDGVEDMVSGVLGYLVDTEEKLVKYCKTAL